MVAVLDEICAVKRNHVTEQKVKKSLADLEAMAREADTPRGFIKALQAKKSAGDFALICEIKKASPSKGLIRADFDPVKLAQAYEAAGAACLSILTDAPYFQGHDEYLTTVRATVALPCLRKDFMIDPYQIVESRALGADCILLILAALDQSLALELESLAHELGMDVLIEVHDAPEMDRALAMKSPLIGINNRNLKTMDVSLDTTLALAPKATTGTDHIDHICVSESGLATHADLQACQSVGVTTFLIGESFMRRDSIIEAVKEIQGLA